MLKSAPLSFEVARASHAVVAGLARDNEPRARELWGAITGAPSPLSGQVAQAIADTLPEDLAGLLAREPVAAAFAFDRLRGVHDAPSPFEVRERARTVWQAVIDRARAANEIAEGFGWDGSAAWREKRAVTPRAVHLAEVMRIARLAGRMYAALKGAQAKRVPGIPAEVYSVTLGSDVSRLLPTELAQLGAEGGLDLPPLYRIATRRAPIFAVRGVEKKSRGPLVLLLDRSASMHGHRNEWAMAAAVAVARVAAEDRRPVVAVHFSTSIHVQALDPRSPASVMEMIESFLSGGTAIAPAIRAGLAEVVRMGKAGARGADFLLITDGIDPDARGQARALADAQKLGVRLHTIAIDTPIEEAEPLRRLATAYTYLGDRELTAEGAVALQSAA